MFEVEKRALIDEADRLLQKSWQEHDQAEKALLMAKARLRYLAAGMESTARRVEVMLDALRLRPRCDQ